jgi:hypothetical protein
VVCELPKLPNPISSHLEPSRAIPSHPEPSQAISSHLEPSRAIPSIPSHPEHPEPSRAIPSHPEPSRAIPSHPEPSRAISSHLEPSRAIPSHPEPSQAIPSCGPRLSLWKRLLAQTHHVGSCSPSQTSSRQLAKARLPWVFVCNVYRDRLWCVVGRTTRQTLFLALQRRAEAQNGPDGAFNRTSCYSRVRPPSAAPSLCVRPPSVCALPQSPSLPAHRQADKQTGVTAQEGGWVRSQGL